MSDGKRDYGNFVLNHPASFAVAIALLVGGTFLGAVFMAADEASKEPHGGGEHATAEHAAPGASGAPHAAGSGAAMPAGEHAPAH